MAALELNILVLRGGVCPSLVRRFFLQLWFNFPKVAGSDLSEKEKDKGLFLSTNLGFLQLLFYVGGR